MKEGSILKKTYISKNSELKKGYNTYINASEDDYGTQMDVGLLIMEDGDTYTIEEAKKERRFFCSAGRSPSGGTTKPLRRSAGLLPLRGVLPACRMQNEDCSDGACAQ
jgi:hypothetical protein